MPSDREAAAIVTEAWRRVHGREPTALERTYAQAIARFETGYGRAGQFGAMAERGEFNWGAEQRRRDASGECPPGFASGTDEGPVCFFVFPSDVEAATAFVRTLTKRHWPVVDAMTGAPEDVATAMRKSPAYYSGIKGSEDEKIQAYANGIRANVSAIARTVPTPDLPSGGAAGSGLSTLGWLLGLGLVGGGFFYVREYGAPRSAGEVARRLTRLLR